MLQWELNYLSYFKEEVDLYGTRMELAGRATDLLANLEEESFLRSEVFFETLSSGVVEKRIGKCLLR